MLPNTTFTATLIDKEENALTIILRCVQWKNRTKQVRFITANRKITIKDTDADIIIDKCIHNNVRGFDVDYWQQSDMMPMNDGDFVNQCYTRLVERAKRECY